VAEPSYDLGVLVVHGIGDQRPGGTLREFGALVDCVERWLPRGLTVGGLQAQVGEAPAHMTIELADVGGTPLRVLVAEGHWADTVRPPGTWTLLKWLAAVVPFVVPRALDGQIRRRSERMDQFARWHPRYVVDGAVRLVLNVGTVAATLLVLVVLFALWLLGLPRAAFDDVDRKRRREPHDPLWVPVAGGLVLCGTLLVAVGRGGSPGRYGAGVAVLIAVALVFTLPRLLNSLVARFIGDAYALLRKERGPKIVERVERRLTWLEQHVAGARTATPPRIVVVAHSQGAEVVRLALERRAGRIDGLVTLGSGIEKLAAVRLLRAHWWRALGVLLMRAVSAALVVLAVAAVLPWPWPAPAWWLAPPAVVGAWLLLRRARRTLRQGVGIDDVAGQLGPVRRKATRWADFYADPDPVPEGALPLTADWGTSQAIANDRVFLLDHLRYWHNVQAFVAPVALELARMGGGASRRRSCGSRFERAPTRAPPHWRSVSGCAGRSSSLPA